MMASYLVDTHVLIWWFLGSSRLNDSARGILDDESSILRISSASLHEFAIKQAKTAMPISGSDLAEGCKVSGIDVLAFDTTALKYYDSVTMSHKDPFDRALIAQAISRKLPLITADKALLKLKLPGLRLIKAD